MVRQFAVELIDGAAIGAFYFAVALDGQEYARMPVPCVMRDGGAVAVQWQVLRCDLNGGRGGVGHGCVPCVDF